MLSINLLISCQQEEADWTQLKAFRIYDYQTFPQGKDIGTFSESDIQKMRFIETNLTETKWILSKAEPLGNRNYLWKGHHFAMASFINGQERKIRISVYGGFLMDETNNAYFEFHDHDREEWEIFWRKNYNELHR